MKRLSLLLLALLALAGGIQRASAIVVTQPASLQVLGVCHAYKTGAQSLSAATWQAFVYESELVDTAGSHSTSSNQERFTAPSGTTHARCSFLVLNDAADWKIYVGGSYLTGYLWRSTGTRQTIDTTFPISGGSYFEFRGYRTAGAAISISSATDEGGTAYYNHATIEWLRM